MSTVRDMTLEEAARWLEQVGAMVYHNQRKPEGPRAWVVVVRAPAREGAKGKLIMGFGASMAQATAVVEESWHQLLQRGQSVN